MAKIKIVKLTDKEVETLDNCKDFAEFIECLFNIGDKTANTKDINAEVKARDWVYYLNKGIRKCPEFKNDSKAIIDNIMPLLNRYPMIGVNIILKEIALDLDKKYSDHIKDSEQFFAIDSLNGNIVKVNKPKSFLTAALFRNSNDAAIAHDIVNPLLKIIFG